MKLRKLTPMEVGGPVVTGLSSRRPSGLDAHLGLSATEQSFDTRTGVRDSAPRAEPEGAADSGRLNRAERESLVGGGPEVMGFARNAYTIAIAAAMLWAGALIAFEVGYETRFGAFEYEPFKIVVLLALVLLPTGFMLLGAFATRQAARLAAETRRARALAGELTAPAALAALQTGGVVQTMREEIDRASAAALHARDQLSTLRESLAGETERLAQAAVQAGRSAQGLTASLARERGAIGEVAAALDGQALAIAEAITRQVATVGDVSDLARAQIHEAEAALAARSADLASTAAEAVHAATSAGDALAGQTDRLERAGAFLGERYRGLEVGLSDRHAALEGLADLLQADQAQLDTRLAGQRVDLLAAAAQGRADLNEIGEAALAGMEGLRHLAAAAADQARAVGQAARSEQTALDVEAHAAMTGLAETAEQTRRAVAEHADAAQQAAQARAASARAEIEQLNEAAFAAGQRADQTFEARLTAARRLVEQSAAVVDEAGARSAARIEAGLYSSKEALGALHKLLTELDGRVARLPVEVQAHTDALRSAVTVGVGELTAAARKAAEETQSIDAAFQARVRRNYEMLSEAVQLMGKVAAGGGGPAADRGAASTASRAPAAPPRGEASSPALPPPALPEAPRSSAASPGASLRPRLTLAAAADAAPAPLKEPASIDRAAGSEENAEASRPLPVRAPTPRTEEWTWKDLLASIEETPVDDDALADRLIGEIEGMGIDGAALLPQAVLEHTARAVQAGAGQEAREAVRRAAPAAIRRLARRLATDKIMRAHAERYIRRYDSLLGEAARRDPEGFMAAALLGSDAGRASLLLDAALHDLT